MTGAVNNPLGAFQEENKIVDEKNDNYSNGHCVILGNVIKWLVPELPWLNERTRTARVQHDPTPTSCWALTFLVDVIYLNARALYGSWSDPRVGFGWSWKFHGSGRVGTGQSVLIISRIRPGPPDPTRPDPRGLT